jgi:hypothetical protein
MEKYYFHFGDYYGDGHRQYVTLCYESPKSLEEIQSILKKIEELHPTFDDWKCGLALQYDEPHIGNASWEEIIKLGYPYERLGIILDDLEFDKFQGWDDLKNRYDLSTIYVNIDFVMDVFVFIMNYYGAELTEVVEDKSNHFDFGYGYGCFYD